MSFFVISGCKPKEPVYKATLVEIMASGCPGCEALKPVIAGIKLEYKDAAKVVVLDINTPDGNQKAGLYTFKGTPTLIFLDADGVEYFKLDRGIQKDIIEALLNSKIAPSLKR
jgi:thiol-disulfide isomerase/thioredoxin